MGEAVVQRLLHKQGDGSSESLEQSVQALRDAHWASLPAEASPRALIQACAHLMEQDASDSRILGACMYFALLGAYDAPSLSLLDSIALLLAVRRTKEAFAHTTKQQSESQQQKIAHPPSLLHKIVHCIHEFAASVPLHDQSENLRALLDLLSFVVYSGLDTDLSATACMLSLLDKRHGEVVHLAAMILQRLTPAVIGKMPCSKEGVKASVGVTERIASDVPVSQPAVCAQLRQAAVHCPSKSQQRSMTVDACCRILNALPRAEVFAYAFFVHKLSRTGKANQRQLAVEIASAMLERVPGAHTPPSLELDEEEAMLGLGSSNAMDVDSSPWSLRCINVLVERSSDRVVSIRTKALASLRSIFTSAYSDERTASTLKSFGKPTDWQRRTDSGNDDEFVQAPETADAQGKVDDPAAEQTGQDEKRSKDALRWVSISRKQTHGIEVDLYTLLHKRALDSKGSVRKSALQALEAWIYIRRHVQDKDIAIFHRACREQLLTVRKQGMTTLAGLMNEFPTNEDLMKTFIASVMPLTTDSETSVLEAASEELRTHIFDRLVRLSKELHNSKGNQQSPHELNILLGAIAYVATGASSFATTVNALIKRSMLTKSHLEALKTCVNSSSITQFNQYGLWAMIQEVSAQGLTVLPWTQLKDEWTKCNSGHHHSDVDALVLRCIGNSSKNFPQDEAKQLAKEIHGRLITFNMPLGSVSAHVYALTKLYSSNGTQKEETTMEWACEICNHAQRVLQQYVYGRKEASKEVEAALFSIGEVATSSPNALSDSLKSYVQALLAPSIRIQQDANEHHAGTTSAASINAHAWIALGKLCIVDEKLAKRCQPLFVQELRQSDRPAVRNNILIVLSDLCVRYTALVDPYVLRVAASLRDPCELVRRQTVILLDSLLQKDYLKWRAPLFIRFCRILADESSVVQSLAKRCLLNHLSTKVPLMAYNHFVDVLFALNDKCPRDGKDYFSGSSDHDRARFALPGGSEIARGARHQVYSTLLNAMSAEHRLATAAKLSNDVLAPVSDDALPMDEYLEVVYDTLIVLSSSAMNVRAAARGGTNTGAGDEDDIDEAGASQQQNSEKHKQWEAKKRLISTLARNNLTENIVPVLIEIKHKVETHRFPLSAEVMKCFTTLLKNHESSIETILAADKQLAKEVRFELQSAKTRKRKQNHHPQPWQDDGFSDDE